MHIREGSAGKILEELSEGVNKDNLMRGRFCTEDKHPSDLLGDGSIDYNIRLAISKGMDPIDCIKMASLNAAECYGLKWKGAIVTGYFAAILIIDNLENFDIMEVYQEGKLVAKDNVALFSMEEIDSSSMMDTVNIGKITEEDLKISLENNKVNVIQLLPHNLITKRVERIDILKVAVIERHNKTGNIGLGLVEGFGLKNGAIASTVAHDSHNIIVIGDNDEDMLKAIYELEKVGGGITMVFNGEIIDTLPLEIAGLMSQSPLDEVNEKLNKMLEDSYEILGISRQHEPFMTLSFIALPVIPDIKLTDMGLFDVLEFKFIGLEA